MLVIFYDGMHRSQVILPSRLVDGKYLIEFPVSLADLAVRSFSCVFSETRVATITQYNYDEKQYASITENNLAKLCIAVRKSDRKHCYQQ